MKQLAICRFAGLFLVSVFMSDAQANDNCVKVFKQFAAELKSIATAYDKMTDSEACAYMRNKHIPTQRKILAWVEANHTACRAGLEALQEARKQLQDTISREQKQCHPAVAEVCNDVKAEPNNRISACTSLIQSGKQQGTALAKILQNRGAAYRADEDYDHAIADFDKSIQLDPTDANLFTLRGGSYLWKKEYDRALADFNEAIRLQPTMADAFDGRGIAYSGKKDREHAVKDFSEAIRLDSHNAVLFYHRGNEYFGWHGQFDEDDLKHVIDDYSEAIRLDPKNDEYYDLRGRAWRKRFEYDRAIADYNEAIRLDPDSAYYQNRGNAYAGKEDFDRAIADYDEAIKQNPKDDGQYVARGTTYFEKGNYQHAIADLSGES